MSRPDTPLPADAVLQQLHAHAVDQLSPATLARLRAARQAPQRARAHGWWLATACSLLVALGVGISFTARPPAAPPAQMAALAPDDSSELLDENPDLYLWLGATDLAME
ncbi:hypothetical protein ACIGHF_04415 [Stenotrophomonas sp. NPDC077464]|uniref:hypothetical protein n=1 Tax=unclassified Stenotrophomonas TaxID=196198 RepID=UPI0037D166A3